MQVPLAFEKSEAGICSTHNTGGLLLDSKLIQDPSLKEMPEIYDLTLLSRMGT